MREDMFKVIVERPRWGVHKAPRVKLRHERTGARHMGVKRQAVLQASWTKGLNENLRPLERYLWKQRGRRWDDVYHDICAVLDTGSTVKMHVRDHLDDFVIRRVHVDANGRWFGVRLRYGATQAVEHWNPDLYVDPVDGILRGVDSLCARLGVKRHAWRQRPVDFPEPRHVLDGTHECRLLNGIWFLVRLGPPVDCVPEGAAGEWLDAPMEQASVRYSWRYGALPKRPVLEKRQLGKKALKRYGLDRKQAGGAHV